MTSEQAFTYAMFILSGFLLFLKVTGSVDVSLWFVFAPIWGPLSIVWAFVCFVATIALLKYIWKSSFKPLFEKRKK